ncbi:MAG: urease accessory protein UreF, partial [Hyphomicrobiaceae bacterium]
RALDGDVAYPVAAAMAAAGHGIACTAALHAYAIGFAGNMVSAAIRLSVIGQTDGQHVLAALMPELRKFAHAIAKAPLSSIGSSTMRSDLASLAHETQYSRLFRS